MGYPVRSLSYTAEQAAALTEIRVAARALDRAVTDLRQATFAAWKAGVVLHDIGYAAGRGRSRANAARWAMRSRDIAMRQGERSKA